MLPLLTKKSTRIAVDDDVLRSMRHSKIDSDSKTWNDYFRKVVDVMQRDVRESRRIMKKTDEETRW